MRPALLLPGLLAAGQALADCPAAPDPVLTLEFDSRYEADDATRSTLDTEAEAAALAALDPLEAFLRDLATQTEQMLEAEGDERRAKADCLTRQMATWARADALSDLRSDTVRLTIGARLAALALMLRAAQPETTEYGPLDVTRRWLARRVTEQMTFWETAPDGAGQGNLRAWAALAAAATADLTEDAVMRGWAGWSLAYVACTADAEGALPQEMSRGRLALHYQLHALAPMVPAALLLERQGLPILARCDGAIQRAARFALEDLAAGGVRSAARSGAAQSFFDGSAELQDFQLAWLEAYLLLTPDPQAEALAAPLRPLKFSKLGGNQTLLWRLE